MSPHEPARWAMLQAQAHKTHVQEMIRQEIRKGTIRVAPGRDGGIRIIPEHDRAGSSLGAPPAAAGRVSA